MNKNPPSLFKAWMTAIRARTIPIPTVSVLAGSALAYSFLGYLDWIMVLFTWLVAVFITFGTNLINDVIDFEKGGDLAGRAGHLKVIRAGLISKEKVYAAGIAAFVLTVLCAIPLALHAGWGMMALVLISVVVAYCYTGGPYPISYLGLSELFILIFYGIVCVGASFYVQTGFFNGAALLCSLQIGLLAILPNALNNFRDMYEDAAVNKKTLAVRFGADFARWEIALLLIIPFLLGAFWFAWGYWIAAVLPLSLIPMSFIFVRSIWNTTPGPLFNRYFALGVLILLFFGVLLATGFFLE